jgi:hypothetical protein
MGYLRRWSHCSAMKAWKGAVIVQVVDVIADVVVADLSQSWVPRSRKPGRIVRANSVVTTPSSSASHTHVAVFARDLTCPPCGHLRFIAVKLARCGEVVKRMSDLRLVEAGFHEFLQVVVGDDP